MLGQLGQMLGLGGEGAQGTLVHEYAFVVLGTMQGYYAIHDWLVVCIRRCGVFGLYHHGNVRSFFDTCCIPNLLPVPLIFDRKLVCGCWTGAEYSNLVFSWFSVLTTACDPIHDLILLEAGAPASSPAYGYKASRG